MQVSSTSKQYSINWQDIIKGLLMAVLTPVIVIIQNSISLGAITFDWKNISMAAIGGGLAYLIKNFMTPAQTVIAGTPNLKVVNQDGSETTVVSSQPKDEAAKS